MKRRNFLKIAGSTGVILAASGVGIGSFMATRTPHAALKPWRTAGGSQYADPMRRALSFAILAPNPHNRQPWVVDLKSGTEAVLTCDLQRLLPATDPFSRQITIGLGCFLELLTLAATHSGHRAQITLFPEGEPGEHLDTRPVAHMQLIEESQITEDPLLAHVLYRHTNRNAYDTSRSITEDALHEIVRAASIDVLAEGVVHGPQLQALRTLTRDALRDEILDPKAFQESVDLMRIGRTEIEANPDGIYLGGAFLETLNLVSMLTREELADPDSSAFQVGLDMVDEQALTAMGFVWINTLSNDRFDQIMAGRSYLRVALRATSLGLAMQPMSQALQEYATMQSHFEQVHMMLTEGAGERVQMLARLGYAEEVRPSPRWALSTRIKRS
ncbi:MAG: twin-arginine translocation pathway signal protein [Gammaproteobacteria bacterium]|nr:twin-arginine translocation pathway signal protein [Gammaproteobacteria bacterium]